MDNQTIDLTAIKTEKRNPRTARIDELSTLDMVTVINQEDKMVAEAVEKELPRIAEAIDMIATRLQAGGRLVYIGAGTSGRLGILDASECPPTFSAPSGLVIGLIAGGDPAIRNAVEGAEDDASGGERDLKAMDFCEKDTLVGIAASGRTPYVLGAINYAKRVGARVISVTCCKRSPVDLAADISIAPEPGAEVVTGSTRLKSGTAQKMVLNMLSTGAMIRLGKVYGNLMVDVKASNEKLRRRCLSIVREATGAGEDEAARALKQCDFRCKTAIVMLLKGIPAAQADALLDAADGRVAKALTL